MNSELQTLIASVGFHIALSMYLLVRIEGKLQNLTYSIFITQLFKFYFQQIYPYFIYWYYYTKKNLFKIDFTILNRF